MKKIKNTGVCLLLILVSTMSALGQMKERIHNVEGKSIEVSTLNQHISNIMDSVGAPGLSIAVINNNEIVYHNVFGSPMPKQKNPLPKRAYLKELLFPNPFSPILP